MRRPTVKKFRTLAFLATRKRSLAGGSGNSACAEGGFHQSKVRHWIRKAARYNAWYSFRDSGRSDWECGA